MEERASGLPRDVMFTLLLLCRLSLLKPTAGNFNATGALSIGTADVEESTGLPTFSTAGFSQGTAMFGHKSTPEISESHPSFPEKETQTGDNESSFPMVTESWTTQSRSDMSTVLLNSSPKLNINPATDWEDPSTVANITEANLGFPEERQPASEFRTVRDLTFTNLNEQDLGTIESVSHADNTYRSTTISRAGERTLLAIILNSTSMYTDDSSFLKNASHPFSKQLGNMWDNTDYALSAEAEHSGIHDPSTTAEHTSVPSNGPSTIAKHTEITAKDPSTTAENTGLPSNDLSTMAEHTGIISGDPSTTAEHTWTRSNDSSTKAKHTRTPSKDPSTTAENTGIPSKDPSTTAENTGIPSGDPSTTAENTGIPSGDPSTTAEHTGTRSNDSSTKAKHTRTPSKDPSTTAENTGIPSKDPSTTAENTGIPSGDPSTTAENTGITSGDSSTKAKHTRTPSKDPSTTAENTGIPSGDPSTTAENTGITSGDSSTTAENTGIPSGDPYTMAEHTGITLDDSSTMAKHARIPSKDPSTMAENAGIPSGDPSTMAGNTGIPSGDPSTMAENTGITSDDSSTIAKHTRTPSKDPSTMAENTGITSGDPSTTAENTGITSDHSSTIAKHTRTPSKDPSTTAENTGITSDDSSTKTKHTKTPSKDPSTTAENTGITSDDFSTMARHARIPSKDPFTTAKHTGITVGDPTTTAENTGYTSDDPSTVAENTNITSKEPSTTAENTGTPPKGLSTTAEHTDVTIEDFSTNATDQTHVSQSHTRQPNITGPEFELTPEISNPNTTLSVREINTTDNSSTSGTFYTPFAFPNDSHTNLSQQKIETTEPPKSTVGTTLGKETDRPQFSMEETTTPPLITAFSKFWEVTTSMYVPPSKIIPTQEPSAPQTNRLPEPTEVQATSSGPVTQKPRLIEGDTHAHVARTKLPSSSTEASLTTRQLRRSTTAETYITPSTLPFKETTQKSKPIITVPSHPTFGTISPPPSSSSSQTKMGATDESTLHLETSTASPSSSTTQSRHTTASYSKSAPTMRTAVQTTGKSTRTKPTTTEMLVKSTLTSGLKCGGQPCANGGRCVLSSDGYRCECLPAWTGSTCTEDVNECVSSPCPQNAMCVNTRGSFSCQCPLGADLQDGRSCTQVKTFLGTFGVNSSLHLRNISLHALHREILQLLNTSLSSLRGYRRSILKDVDGLRISAVHMFSMCADTTSNEIHQRIQMSLRHCSKSHSHCILQHQLAYHVESLCLVLNNRCDTQYSVCDDTFGIPYCQCHQGYFKKNPEDTTCRDCGDGFKLVNGTCAPCAFGFGGFNCNNFYGLIAKVVSPAAGGLLFIVIIALIVTCCRKDKNDINKIIFKSGELQMSPYGEFPKSSRVSMEWGRETIEMQENGSTKNLLQMTDIYYSPALRNADLDRNGFYAFSGLPGSRHSCIYPAQWNPSFISDDSRRRDYF